MSLLQKRRRPAWRRRESKRKSGTQFAELEDVRCFATDKHAVRSLHIADLPGVEMALLLHLSVLHLATADDNDVVADRKEDVIDLGLQQTRLSILKNSLRAFGESLLEAGETLDSILVSGDIAVRGQQDGLDLFDSVLDCLGGGKTSRRAHTDRSRQS